MHGNVERLPSRHNRVAVLLNANAKAVTEGFRRELEQFVPPEDLFYSRTFEDARAIARTVLDRGYATVLTGGGDGTFVAYLNCILEEAARLPPQVVVNGSAVRLAAPHSVQIPRFGVLKLGTGNAVAEFAGSSPRHLGVVEDILRTRSGEVQKAHALHLVECDGKRAPFAGLGIDAAVLNDYVRVKTRLAGGKLQFAGVGGLGYFWALAGRTIPAFLTQRGVPNVEVLNLGGPVRQIGPDGKPLGREIPRGEVLYRGPCYIAAAGTVPCYGFGFQMFPFALKAPGRFQLRLSAMGLVKMLTQASRMWRGQTPRTGVLDFQCERVRISFDREMPFQVGGDAEGYRRQVELGMSDESLQLLNFKRVI
jgi:diacylglycerol kinase family enzyme